MKIPFGQVGWWAQQPESGNMGKRKDRKLSVENVVLPGDDADRIGSTRPAAPDWMPTVDREEFDLDAAKFKIANDLIDALQNCKDGDDVSAVDDCFDDMKGGSLLSIWKPTDADEVGEMHLMVQRAQELMAERDNLVYLPSPNVVKDAEHMTEIITEWLGFLEGSGYRNEIFANTLASYNFYPDVIPVGNEITGMAEEFDRLADGPGIVRNAAGQIVVEIEDETAPNYVDADGIMEILRGFGGPKVTNIDFSNPTNITGELVFNDVDPEVMALVTGIEPERCAPDDGEPCCGGVGTVVKDPLTNDQGENVIEEADRIINGPRAQFYGDATINHQRIADLWNAYIGHLDAKNGESTNLQPHDIAVLMILLKIARVVESPQHRDSWVDTIGYAALAHRMAVKTDAK